MRLLKFVGPDLLHQPNATALVASHIQQNASRLLLQDVQEASQLRPAVAALGAQDVSREALRVHSDLKDQTSI